MLFNSVEFLFFFPAVIVAYYLTPYTWRWLLLIAASYIFYGSWKVEFLSLIALSTVVDFYVGKKISTSNNEQKRWKLLLVSLACNLGLLGIFKYGAFFCEMALIPIPISEWRKGQIISFLTFDLPVGISFYTFQTMGYTIDVFKGKIKPEKHLGKFALYVSYFPQLVAGPIERFAHLQPQLLSKQAFNYQNLTHGFRLMLYGFFIKMVIADNIVLLVDPVFNAPLEYNAVTRWSAIFGFGWQIYADFYGYSLLAIGAARCMGIELMDNFRLPYFATSIQDFWRRWHISLSTWFKDYVFIPLGGSKVNRLMWFRNIMIVFILSGFWHGAHYTFLIWGAIHGGVYVLEQQFSAMKVPRVFAWISTYFVVSVAWVFFRASDITNASEMLNYTQVTNPKTLELPLYIFVSFGLFLVLEYFFKKGIQKRMSELNFYIRWTIYCALIVFILFYSGTTQQPFIYFQF